MNLNRKQLSLIITVFTMANVLLLAYNVHLVDQEEDEYVIEMALLDEEELEELMHKEEQDVNQTQQSSQVKSHMAMNETAKPSFGSPEPLKTLEELLAEREANQDASDFLADEGGYAASLKELAKKRAERKEQLGEREAEKKEFTNYLKDKRTSISYSLVDRYHYDLPPPIYTCEQGGKVVVNIKVDGDGYVYDADFNAKSSTTSNYCLVENAIAYALKARFNDAAKSSQLGTITYLFQSK